MLDIVEKIKRYARDLKIIVSSVVILALGFIAGWVAKGF